MTKESSTTSAAQATPSAATTAAVTEAAPVATDETSGAASVAAPETTGERATAMRATLGARRDAESMLAEASALRRTAANDADAMVAEAEALAEQLVAESRAAAEKAVVEAQERADGILARARIEAADTTAKVKTEAEDIVATAKAEADEFHVNVEAEREKMRAEVTAHVTAEVEKASRAQLEELQTKSDALLRQVELGIHGLGPALEGAMSVVTDVIGSLERLRSVTPGEVPDFAELKQALDAVQLPEPTRPTSEVVLANGSSTALATTSVAGLAAVAEDAPVVATTDEAAEPASSPTGDDAGARPLGWLFRASQS